MVLADFEPIIQAIIAGIALLLTGLIGVYVPKAIAAFERRTGVEITAQQQAAIMQAARTAAGIIKIQLAQGLLKTDQIRARDLTILEHVAAAINRVPHAAAAMGKTVPSMAETIVGMVGNANLPLKGATHERPVSA